MDNTHFIAQITQSLSLIFDAFSYLILVFIVNLGKASKKKGTNWGHCPKFGYPLPPSELGTYLNEMLLTVFFTFVELWLTDQLSQFWCQNT